MCKNRHMLLFYDFSVWVKIMKSKSLIVLLIVLVAALACTGIGAAYIMSNASGEEIEFTENGEAISDEFRMENLRPGESRTITYKAASNGAAVFQVTFEGDQENKLNRQISISVLVNDEYVLEQKPFAECVKTGVSCDVDGDFTFSIIYTLNKDAGNEVQGVASDIVAYYTLTK